MENSKKLKGKDLITIGIFSAIYFVINFFFMILGGIHPAMWMLMPGFIALFTGIPVMLLMAKVSKPGTILILGLITGLIYFVTGQFTVVILISFGLACILAELIRFLTRYQSYLGNTVAFAVFSVGMVGSPLPIWIFHESFVSQITKQGMPEDYIASLEAFSSTPMLVLTFVAPIVLGVIGALLARGVLKKHFVKAGLI